MLSRRGFLKILSTGALIAIAPLKFVAPRMHGRWVDSLTYSELIATTLRKHRAELVANITRSNPLYKRLKHHA